MTREEIIHMAREAGTTFVAQYGVASATPEWLERFATLVAAAEREACAKNVERNAAACDNNAMLRDVLMSNAAAIRARGDA